MQKFTRAFQENLSFIREMFAAVCESTFNLLAPEFSFKF